MYQHLTLQEIFDKTKKMLLRQKELSYEIVRGKKGCRYRLEKDGKLLRCSGGCWIPKRSYKTSMEGKMLEAIDYFDRHFTEEQIYLLRDLQDAHDTCENFKDLEPNLKYVAETYNLQY